MYRNLQDFNSLSTNPTKWSDTLKQFNKSNLPTNCFSLFDHLVKLALKGLSELNPSFMKNIFTVKETDRLTIE